MALEGTFHVKTNQQRERGSSSRLGGVAGGYRDSGGGKNMVNKNSDVQHRHQKTNACVNTSCDKRTLNNRAETALHPCLPAASLRSLSESNNAKGNGRWIPLTGSRNSNISQEEVVFRNVRGILNKLTPEKFEKLTNQLVNVGIYNVNILRGVIILLFEKALDEPHYSSLYAETCVKLNAEAPNFEEPGSRGTTFRKLLLKKCQEEFENRQEIFSQFEKIDDSIGDEEKEKRILAKRKMLGNIKFIGELGKLKILSSKVVHDCIRQLLSKVKNADPDEVECLCKLLTTVGKVLDTPEAKLYMDQYFERMEDLAGRKNLPSRHRFMLQDVLDLRKNNWVQRQWKQNKGPRSITEIRKEVDKEYRKSGYRSNPQMAGAGIQMMPGSATGLLRGPNPATQPVGRGTGSPVYDARGQRGVMHSTMGGHQTGSIQGTRYQSSQRGGKSGMQRGGFQGSATHAPSINFSGSSFRSSQVQPMNGQASPIFSTSSKSHKVGAKFHSFEGSNGLGNGAKKNVQTGSGSRMPNQGSFLSNERSVQNMGRSTQVSDTTLDEDLRQSALKYNKDSKIGKGDINLRPQLGFSGSSTAPISLPPSASVKQMSASAHELPVGPNVNPLIPSTAFTRLDIDDEDDESVSPSVTEGTMAKKEQSYDEFLEKCDILVAEYISSMDMDNAIILLKDFKKSKHSDFVVDVLISATFDRLERDRQAVVEILKEAHTDNTISSMEIVESLRKHFECVDDLKIDIPHIEQYLLTYIGRFVFEGILQFKTVIKEMELSGSQIATVLSEMTVHGQSAAEEVVKGIDLRSLFDKTITDIEYFNLLKEKKIEFLCADLIDIMTLRDFFANELSSDSIVEWIKTNVSVKTRKSRAFIANVCSMILQNASKNSIIFKDGAERPEWVFTKEAKSEEARYIQVYVGLLSFLVSGDISLQVGCIYGVQLFAHKAGFPSGYMERMFTALYNLDICEEESFFVWKEDVCEDFLGKGTALFQVNKWLNWLAEDEDESDSDES